MVKRSILALRRHPIRSFLILGVVPTLWGLPELLLQHRIDLSNARLLLALRVAGTAWTSLLWGGLVIASIDLAADGRPTIRAVIKGARFAPAVFIAQVVPLMPMAILEASIGTPLVVQLAAMVLAAPLLLVFLVRTVAWVPLIVDRRHPLGAAFRASWVATRGAGLRLSLIWFLVAIVTVPHGFLSFGRLIIGPILSSFVTPLLLVVFAVVYLFLMPRAPLPLAEASARDENAPPAPAPEDVPVKGSGWARDTKP